jgi:hypothetical protein
VITKSGVEIEFTCMYVCVCVYIYIYIYIYIYNKIIRTRLAKLNFLCELNQVLQHEKTRFKISKIVVKLCFFWFEFKCLLCLQHEGNNLEISKIVTKKKKQCLCLCA